MRKYSDIIACAIVAGATLLRLLFALKMPIHPDEAYYWDWSRHLDWSYYDQGPGVAFYIRFFTLIFGNTVLALKLAALIAAAAAHLFLYYAARSMKLDGPVRLTYLIASILIPGFFTGSFLIMHDSVLILFWNLAFLMIVLWIQNQRESNSAWSYFFLAFVAMALGFLGKHTMVLFAIALSVWFMLSPGFWKILRSPRLYLAIVIAALITLPFWIWNLKHGWDGFGAIINLRSSGGAFANKQSTGPYLIGQFLSFSPVWFGGFLILAFMIGFARVREFFLTIKNQGIKGTVSASKAFFQNETGDPLTRFVWIMALVLPLFFLLMAQKKEIQANWPFASYGPIMLLIVVHSQKRTWLKRTLWIGAVPALLMNAFFLFSEPISNSGFFASIAKSYGLQKDPRVFPHLRLSGYSEVISEVDALRKQIDPDAGIITNRYQDAAIAGFILPGQPEIPSMNILQRNQYSYWPGLEKGNNYILFMIQDNTCAKASFFFQPVLYYTFKKIKEFPEKEVFKDGVAVKRYQAWYLQGYKRDWRGLLMYYLVDSAIYDFMPNLRGYSVETTSSEGLMKMQEFMNEYYKRKGSTDCSVF